MMCLYFNVSTGLDSHESLQDAFRNLQGHYIECQIELQSAKTDRDSLLLELRASKEALSEVRIAHVVV